MKGFTKFVTVVSAACVLMTAMPVMAADDYSEYDLAEPYAAVYASTPEAVSYPAGTNETLEAFLIRIMTEPSRQYIQEDATSVPGYIGTVDTTFEYVDSMYAFFTYTGHAVSEVAAGTIVDDRYLMCDTSYVSEYGNPTGYTYHCLGYEMLDEAVVNEKLYVINPLTGEQSYTFIEGEQRLVYECTYVSGPHAGETRLLWKTVTGYVQ